MAEGSSARNALLAAALIGAAMAGRRLLAGRGDTELAGQVALVTGGSRGLGFILARELAREGCRVAICARDREVLDKARAALEAEGAQVAAIPCDISDQAQVNRMVEEVAGRFGPVDILVNNAGIIQVGPVETMEVQDFQKAMDVMYWGTLYPILAVLPSMRRRHGGRIVNITSIGGKVSVPHLLPYNAAKFASVGLSEGLGAELAKDGISVTTIVPGLMRTGSYINALFKGRQEWEYSWFSAGDSLPFISMDAERAGRQIVEAARKREAVRVLSLPAILLARFHGLFPGLTVRILALVNRLLPSGERDAGAPDRGMEVERRMNSPILGTITALGRDAGRRFQHRED